MQTHQDMPAPAAPAPIPGLAKRSETYADTLKRAGQFTGLPGKVTTAFVAGLLVRVASHIHHPHDPERYLPSRAREVLLFLVEQVYRADRWTSADLTIPISNGRLALYLHVAERTVQGALRDLEDFGLIVRRYDQLNHRAGRESPAGIDLKPLAARLTELAALEQRLADEWAARVEAKRVERDDLTDSFPQQEDSSQGAGFRTRSSYKSSSGSYDPVQRKGASQVIRGSGGGSWFGRVPSDDEIFALMRMASPTFSAYLPNGDASTPTELYAAVQLILKTEFRDLNPSAWAFGLRHHGAAACGAVCIAADRRSDGGGGGIRNRTAYLAKMLRSATLGGTVIHQLRTLMRQGSGAA